MCAAAFPTCCRLCNRNGNLGIHGMACMVANACLCGRARMGHSHCCQTCQQGGGLHGERCEQLQGRSGVVQWLKSLGALDDRGKWKFDDYSQRCIEWCFANNTMTVPEIGQWVEDFIRDMRFDPASGGDKVREYFHQSRPSFHQPIQPEPMAEWVPKLWDALGAPELAQPWHELTNYPAEHYEAHRDHPCFDFVHDMFEKTCQGLVLSRIHMLREQNPMTTWLHGLHKERCWDASTDVEDLDWELGMVTLKGRFASSAAATSTQVEDADTSKARQSNVVLAWHGTNWEHIYQVSQVGVRPLRSTDGGFFGAGSYTTLQAWYASQYSSGKFVPGGRHPTDRGEYAMLLMASAVGSAKVITRTADYNGKGNFRNGGGCEHLRPHVSDYFAADGSNARAMNGSKYDTLFVPVKQVGVSGADFQACPSHLAVAHEMVSRDFAQLCPLAVVYFTKASCDAMSESAWQVEHDERAAATAARRVSGVEDPMCQQACGRPRGRWDFPDCCQTCKRKQGGDHGPRCQSKFAALSRA